MPWFRNSPARAKSDLQKQLVSSGVRKSIANFILAGIGLGSVEPESGNRSISRAERPISRAERPKSRAERPVSVISSRSHLVDPDNGLLTNTLSLSMTKLTMSQKWNRHEADRVHREAITIDQLHLAL